MMPNCCTNLLTLSSVSDSYMCIERKPYHYWILEHTHAHTHTHTHTHAHTIKCF